MCECILHILNILFIITFDGDELKGYGGVSWCGVNYTIPSVQEMERAMEGVVILLNDVWRSAVKYFGCVSSKVL